VTSANRVDPTSGDGKAITLHSRQKLIENILSLYGLLGLYYLIPLAVLPYLVRVLGIEMYGMVAFSQSFAQYFTTVTDYGFNFSATRSIAESRDDAARISRIFCAVYVIKWLLTLLGAVILALIVVSSRRFAGEWKFFSVAYLAVVGNVLFPTWYFQGIEKMRYISIIVGSTRVFAAFTLFFFVHSPSDALLALAIQSGGTLLSGAIGAAVAIRSFRLSPRWPNAIELRETIKDGWHLFLSSASIGLYTNTNVFLVGIFAGNIQAGYFSAAERLLRAIQALIVPVTQATFPHVSKMLLESKDRTLRFIRRSVRWTVGLTFIPCIVMLFLAKPIALLCFGHSAQGAISVVRWISFLQRSGREYDDSIWHGPTVQPDCVTGGSGESCTSELSKLEFRR
jgi:PST family polysaccharide transporter